MTEHDVPPSFWVDELTAAREAGFTFFDWLTAVDQTDALDEPGFDVVAHLFCLDRREHLLLRTRVPAGPSGIEASLPTATGVFAGAAWHERETFEMFGIDFPGHDNLRPLLLPDGFEGRPLRKDFVLAARAAKAWPGAKEPGESDHESAAPSRRKTRPPGVPDPAVWGPRPPSGRTSLLSPPAPAPAPSVAADPAPADPADTAAPGPS